MEQRNVNSQHKHNEQTQAYLEQIRGRKQDEGERSEEMDRRRELASTRSSARTSTAR